MNRVKIVAFLAVFCILFRGVSWFFRPMTPNSATIYYEPPNTIDVLLVGSSFIDFDVNPNVLWREEGIAAFNYTSGAQPSWTTYNYIVEALKYQKPSLVVLDIHSLEVWPENGYSEHQQEIFGTFSPSVNKLNMIASGAEPEQRASMVADLLFFHTRWRDITKDSTAYTEQDYMAKNVRRYKGFRTARLFSRTINLSSDVTKGVYPSTGELGEVPEKHLYYLRRIMELSKEKDFELLLIKTPWARAILQDDIQKLYNSVKMVAEENQIPFADLNENAYRDAIGVDFSTDFLDDSHMNYRGAEKVSKYLAAYLKAEYGLPDRRGNPKYKSWDESADAYFRFEGLEKAKASADLTSYLNAVKDVSQDLIFVTSVKGGIGPNWETLSGDLSQIGVASAGVTGGYICIYEPSSGYVYEDMSSAKILRKNIYKEDIPVNLEVISAGNAAGNLVSIKIDGVERSKNQRGLNIVVYDKRSEGIFDSFYVDTVKDDTFKIKR